MWPIISNPSRYVVPFHPFTHPFSHILLSFKYVPCIALLVCSLPSHPFSLSVWLSSSYSALPHTGRTRPPGPHPVPCISIITHAHTRWSRYHQARLPPLHHGPGSRSCLGLSPWPTRKAQITSPPHLTPPRRPHPHRSMGRSLSRHDSLRPPASSGRTSRTNHDSTQPTCAQWSWSRSSRTGVAGPAPGPTAADPSGATRLTLPPHPLRSRYAHPTPSGRLSPDCPPQSCTYQASPPERADSPGCE